MNSVAIIVPARGGSKRLPGKNLRKLGGVSLLDWTWRAVQAAGLAQTPFLSTEDAEIAAEGKRLGYHVPELRPSELAQDETPTLDVVLHVLDTMAEQAQPELVVLLQVTSPFRPPALLKEGLRRMQADSSADGLLAVKPLHVGRSHVYGAQGGVLAPLSTEAGPAYVPSGALYITRTKALREHRSFIPPRCLFVAHDGLSSLDIDTEDDWLTADAAFAAGRVSLP